MDELCYDKQIRNGGMNMKDTDWEILSELYKNPNMTKVADLLFMTQPSLTKRIQHMETEFDVRIVNRTRKGLEFTREGTYLAEQAGRYLRFLEDTRKRLQEMRQEEKEVITVGASYTFGKYALMDLLMEYRRSHPDVLFHVISEQSSVLFRRMLDDSIDVGFINGDYEGAVNKILIGQTQAYLISGKELDPSALDPSQKIDYKTNDRTKELIGRWWREQYGADEPEGIVAGYVDVAWDLVERGAGYTISFLPDRFENRQNFVLTPLFYKDGTPVVRNIWFVYAIDKRISGTLEEFVQYIEQHRKV